MDERLGLLDELRTGKCTVSIITTYSVDFQFYEAVVLRKLNAAGCEHHLLLVDAERCGEALADPDRRPRLAGVSYALVPIACRGAFHPKLIVLAGKKGSRLFVGSHNVTFPGFGGNAEITNSIAGTDGTAIGDALAAVRLWLGGKSVGPAGEIVDHAASLLGARRPSSRPDNAFLFSALGRPPLWDQLREYLPRKVRRVVLVGPFFDAGMRFVRRAIADLGAREFVVAVDPSYSMLNPSEARRLQARFVDGRLGLAEVGFAGASSLHAKVMVVEGDDRRLLVSGSANPSAAAWLDVDTNAEAVLVRNDVSEGELVQLGLAQLLRAPELSTAQWSEIDERVRADAKQATASAEQALVGVEEGNRIVIDGVSERPTFVRVHLGDAEVRDVAVDSHEGTQVALTGGALDLSLCNLAEICGKSSALAVINHRAALSPRTTSAGSGRELRTALGSVSDDPARIEEVLRLVERAIDDVDVSGAVEALRVGRNLAPQGDAEEGTALGPRVMRLEDVKRRHAKPRSLATGDIAVVIDLLIRRIGEGLGTSDVATKPPEVEESELDPLDEAARAATADVDGHALLKACHRKVGRLARRMAERLDVVVQKRTGAVRATIQLAAVLGVLRWLRRLEPRLSWVPIGESLVPEQARLDLFWSGATRFGLSRPSILDLVHEEMAEPFEELALAMGLLVWLAREALVDLRALPKHPDEDDLAEFHWAGALVSILRHAAVDDAATGAATRAVAESRGADRQQWLDAHLRIGGIAALAEASPDQVPPVQRAVRRGDLVRVTMPNGSVSVGFVVDLDDGKVRLADPENEQGRAVLKQYVVALDVDAES